MHLLTQHTLPTGKTPLFAAATVGSKEVVRMLLAAGASVDAANQHGRTPLLSAAYHGQNKVVQLLLRGGADPQRSTVEGGDVASLHAAADQGQTVTSM